MTTTVEATRPAERTPVHLWVIGILSLIWNSFGAFDYLMTQLQVEAYMGNFSPEQLDYFYGFPAWAVAAWAIAVWFSVAGSISLLLRKAWATWLFGIALVAMAITTLYNYVLTDGLTIMGGGIGMIAFAVAIWVVAIGLFLYSLRMTRQGVLH